MSGRTRSAIVAWNAQHFFIKLADRMSAPNQAGRGHKLRRQFSYLFFRDQGAGQLGVKMSSVCNSFHGHDFGSDASRSSLCSLRHARNELFVSLIPIINSDHCAYIKGHSNSAINC